MLEGFLNTEILGNALTDYLLAIAIAVIAFISIRTIKFVVVGRIKQWAHQTATDLDNRLIRIIERPVSLLLYLGAFYVAVSNLSLHSILQQSVNVVCVALGTLLVVQLLGSLVEYSARMYLVRRGPNLAMEQTINTVVPGIKVIVWAIGIVFLLDNLGFDISAVVAGLGIGGIAVALAAQGILGDLFSYVSILFDRPFELGDFIIVGDFVGTVEHIGLKTTRLQSLTGEELIIANTDITSSRIQNFKRMARRRIAFSLGVTYDTTTEQMKQIPSIIKNIIDRTDSVTFDRAHFSSYGDFSLNYEVVYFVETNDYSAYMDVQQSIYLAVKEAFESRSIVFAYPTQTVYLENLSAAKRSDTGSNGRSFAVTTQTSDHN
ncbi:MAG: mechanosensitive ion channel family protein [Cyanobacteria bacterium P01_D01_bin.56]